MAISLKPQHVKRYADVVRLLWKYGRADWVTRAGLEGALADDEALVEGTLAVYESRLASRTIPTVI